MQSIGIQRAAGAAGLHSCGCRAAGSRRPALSFTRHLQRQTNWTYIKPKNLQLVAVQETSRAQASTDDAFATAKRYNVSYTIFCIKQRERLWLTNLAVGLVQVMLALIVKFLALPDRQPLLTFLRAKPEAVSIPFISWIADQEATAVGEQKRVC
jgi:hypothetical protein